MGASATRRFVIANFITAVLLLGPKNGFSTNEGLFEGGVYASFKNSVDPI